MNREKGDRILHESLKIQMQLVFQFLKEIITF